MWLSINCLQACTSLLQMTQVYELVALWLIRFVRSIMLVRGCIQSVSLLDSFPLVVWLGNTFGRHFCSTPTGDLFSSPIARGTVHMWFIVHVWYRVTICPTTCRTVPHWRMLSRVPQEIWKSSKMSHISHLLLMFSSALSSAACGHPVCGCVSCEHSKLFKLLKKSACDEWLQENKTRSVEYFPGCACMQLVTFEN